MGVHVGQVCTFFGQLDTDGSGALSLHEIMHGLVWAQDDPFLKDLIPQNFKLATSRMVQPLSKRRGRSRGASGTSDGARGSGSGSGAAGAADGNGGVRKSRRERRSALGSMRPRSEEEHVAVAAAFADTSPREDEAGIRRRSGNRSGTGTTPRENEGPDSGGCGGGGGGSGHTRGHSNSTLYELCSGGGAVSVDAPVALGTLEQELTATVAGGGTSSSSSRPREFSNISLDEQAPGEDGCHVHKLLRRQFITKAEFQHLKDMERLHDELHGSSSEDEFDPGAALQDVDQGQVGELEPMFGDDGYAETYEQGQGGYADSYDRASMGAYERERSEDSVYDAVQAGFDRF